MSRRSYQDFIECTNCFLKPSQSMKCLSLASLPFILKICIQFHCTIKIDNGLLKVLEFVVSLTSPVKELPISGIQFYRMIKLNDCLLVITEGIVCKTSVAIET